MRILGRIEKALLSLFGGFAFMFVATTVAPGLQTLVASTACPGGTTDAVVVRYPGVAEPVEMVRNTPLVCVVDGRAELADHAKVLPALALMGTAGTAAVIVLASLLVAVLRRSTREGEPPRPPRTAYDGIRWLPLLIAMPFVFQAAYGAYWWLAVDTPYRKEGCRSSSGGSATCYDGEPMYRMMTIGVTALAAIGLLIWVTAVLRSRRRSRRFARVARHGTRTTAALVAVDRTATKVNGGRIYRYTYEVHPTDGSGSFRFEEKDTMRPASTVGATVDVLYDPGDPANAFVAPPMPAAPVLSS